MIIKTASERSVDLAREGRSVAHEQVLVVVMMYDRRSFLADLVDSLTAGLAGVDLELVAMWRAACRRGNRGTDCD